MANTFRGPTSCRRAAISTRISAKRAHNISISTTKRIPHRFSLAWTGRSPSCTDLDWWHRGHAGALAGRSAGRQITAFLLTTVQLPVLHFRHLGGGNRTAVSVAPTGGHL